MSAQIIPFDFEEHAVRVVMRGDDPWFVAIDVCRVLDIVNSSDAMARLDEDEKDGVGIADPIGREQTTRVISESGLYALILTSRKPEAKRFRKWITAEVLPALRKTGRYEMPEPSASAEDTARDIDIAGLPIREAELWLSMVREARLSRGTRAAVSIWARSPLPALDAGRGRDGTSPDPDEGWECLFHLLSAHRDLIAAGCAGSGRNVDAALSAEGLRALTHGLFIANFQLPVFCGTRWAGGAHRAALMALAAVGPAPSGLTLGGIRTRGIVVPWTVIDTAEGGLSDG